MSDAERGHEYRKRAYELAMRIGVPFTNELLSDPGIGTGALAIMIVTLCEISNVDLESTIDIMRTEYEVRKRARGGD